jgi:hypothetical protein
MNIQGKKGTTLHRLLLENCLTTDDCLKNT